MLILFFFSFFFSFRFLYLELPIVQVVAHFVRDSYLDWFEFVTLIKQAFALLLVRYCSFIN
jgi:hypothetical protein